MTSGVPSVHGFDPDEAIVETYDDRAPRIEKVVNEVVRTRNRGNKRRGRTAEKKWTDLINEAIEGTGIEKAEKRGILGGADVTWLTFAFEVKQRQGDWPSNTTIKNALVQAKANAGNRTPVVIACKTTPNVRTEWRFYNEVGMYMDAIDWLRLRVMELTEA